MRSPEADEPVTDDGVLVLAGPPCSGKSSVGRVLAADSLRGRGVLIEVDAVFSLLLPGSDRNRDDRMLSYDAAHALARLLVQRDRIPILECTYSRLEQRASLLKAMTDIPAAPWWVVEFVVSPDDAVRRFRLREQATDLDERLVRERADTFPFSDQALRLVSSEGAPADLAHHIAAWLRNRPASLDRVPWVEAGKDWD